MFLPFFLPCNTVFFISSQVERNPKIDSIIDMEKIIGVSVCLAFMAFGYWLWPDGITSVPFASLTLGMLGKAVFGGSTFAIGLFTIPTVFDN